MPTTAELEARIAALESELDERQVPDDDKKPPAPKVAEEPQVRISRPPETGADLPSNEQLEKLRALVILRFPMFGYQTTGKFANLEDQEHRRAFRAGLRWAQYASPSQEFDQKHYMTWHCDDCARTSGGGRIDFAGFCAALVASADFPYSDPRDLIQFGIRPYGSRTPLRPATWRKVLASGELRAPIVKASAKPFYPAPRVTIRREQLSGSVTEESSDVISFRD